MNRRQFLGRAASLLAGSAWPGRPAGGAAPPPPAAPAGLSTLLIVVEDWTTRAVGCYGSAIAKTPHVDRFASSGLRFERAYCQSPVCNASRASFLTALRPDSTRVYSNRDPMDRRLPQGATSLPELASRSGRYTVNLGKLFHHARSAQRQLAVFDRIELGAQPRGYAGVSRHGDGRRREDAVARAVEGAGRDGLIEERLGELRGARSLLLAEHGRRHPRVAELARAIRELEAERLGDSGLREEEELDGRRARVAAGILEELAATRRPFFMSLGFTRPHTPLLAPSRYVALYPPEAMPLPPAPPAADRGIPSVALRWQRNYDIFNRVEPSRERVRRALAAYYACVSFIDAQIGLVLDALERTGLAERTAVVLLADHGFHLGEHGLWSKLTLFEQATRVPLVVRVPGAPGNGGSCGAPVELVDLVPTLADLWGVAPPDPFEGTSLRPLLDDPARPWKAAAFSVCARRDGEVLGRSIRTRRHRYAEWRAGRAREAELYDLERDPWEQTNLAPDPAHAKLTAALSQQLTAGWRAARPPAP